MSNIYWNNVIKRICQEAHKYLNASNGSRDGLVIVRFKVVVDADNKPRFWWVDGSAKIEPGNVAEEILK